MKHALWLKTEGAGIEGAGIEDAGTEDADQESLLMISIRKDL